MTLGKKKIGRPSTYSEAIATKICALIEEGFSERKISKMKGMPSTMTMRKWKDEHPDFLARSARAREVSAELFNDRRMEEVDWLLEQVHNAARTGESLPKGLVEGARAAMQELAREAAQRDDSRYGDRKTVRLDATENGAGMAEVYARMLEAQKSDAGT